MNFKEYKRLNWEEILARISEIIPDEFHDRDYYRWDYVTALRGSDTREFMMKKIFTGFIRGRSTIIGMHDFMRAIMDPISTADELISESSTVQDHHVNHLLGALHVLRDHLEIGGIPVILLEILRFLRENGEDGVVRRAIISHLEKIKGIVEK